MPKRRVRRREQRGLRILVDVDPELPVDSVMTLARMILRQHGEWITHVSVASTREPVLETT